MAIYAFNSLKTYGFYVQVLDDSHIEDVVKAVEFVTPLGVTEFRIPLSNSVVRFWVQTRSESGAELVIGSEESPTGIKPLPGDHSFYSSPASLVVRKFPCSFLWTIHLVVEDNDETFSAAIGEATIDGYIKTPSTPILAGV